METRIRFECGEFVVEFCGSETFVEGKLVRLISELATLSRECQARRPGSPELEGGEKAGPLELLRFLDQIGAKSQVKTFLGTAAWLHLNGAARMTTTDVREALTNSGIDTVNNYADCLGKHVRAGNCKMTGHKKFEVTPQGLLEVSPAS